MEQNDTQEIIDEIKEKYTKIYEIFEGAEKVPDDNCYLIKTENLEIIANSLEQVAELLREFIDIKKSE